MCHINYIFYPNAIELLYRLINGTKLIRNNTLLFSRIRQASTEAREVSLIAVESMDSSEKQVA